MPPLDPLLSGFSGLQCSRGYKYSTSLFCILRCYVLLGLPWGMGKQTLRVLHFMRFDRTQEHIPEQIFSYHNAKGTYHSIRGGKGPSERRAAKLIHPGRSRLSHFLRLRFQLHSLSPTENPTRLAVCQTYKAHSFQPAELCGQTHHALAKPFRSCDVQGISQPRSSRKFKRVTPAYAPLYQRIKGSLPTKGSRTV